MTEDEVIAKIAELCRVTGNGVKLGIGDDAALWQPSRSHRSAISSDMLVEDVDFTRDAMSLRDAGWRAMAANLSDLAAMGARPVLGTVALGFSLGSSCEEILELYSGIAACAARFKLAIVGGDLSRARGLTIAVTVVGEVRTSNVKLRDGGRPGQVLAVTGPLGAARAGLELTRDPAATNVEGREEAIEAFRRPQPRVAEGKFLGASRNVTAMTDLSDGLSTDVHRLAAASGCGATLEGVPVAVSARAVAQLHGEDADDFALKGGDDFELLVAIRPRAFGHLARCYEKRFGRELCRVGALSTERGVTYRGKTLEPSGWDHFAQQAAT
ncbi:MAG: thiamine-phosphate kinase [Candidatus Eremiobacteraeota bacterium]|nr:thiamine-phosphate kinase [Candidatus Eremiobacteraeota bacterium]